MVVSAFLNFSLSSLKDECARFHGQLEETDKELDIYGAVCCMHRNLNKMEVTGKAQGKR